MEIRPKAIGLALVLLLLTLSSAQARTAYVSDMLILTFREGPGSNYAVLKTLKSNTVLDVLEEDQGYYKVTLESGEEGWVDKQFVIFEPPKALALEQVEREKAALEEQLAGMEETIRQLRAEINGQTDVTEGKLSVLEDQARKTAQENQQLTRELETTRKRLESLEAASQDVVATLDANRALTEENKRLAKSLETAESENSRLFRTGMIKWFLAGVGVLLMGWLIGLMLSSNRRRRSSLLD